MLSIRFTILIIPLLLIPSALSVPQGVTAIIPPPGGSPPGCVDSYAGAFGLEPTNDPTPAVGTQCLDPDTLKVFLNKGILVDGLGRIGSIVANRQFQFDGPPAQAGAVYTGGWSVCPDNLIALGPQKQFYACASGDFENIYDSMIASYCKPIFLKVSLFVDC